MRGTPRKPEGTPSGRRLLDASGIGLVELDRQGVPWRIRQTVEGEMLVAFDGREGEVHGD